MEFELLNAGQILEFFVVPRDGETYSLPRLGERWTIRLQGRQPGRYDIDRTVRDVANGFTNAGAALR